MALAILQSMPGPAIAQRYQSALRQLVEEDAKVARIGYALTVAGAPLCQRQAAQDGMVLQAIDQYDPWLRDDAIASFALGDQVAISAVVPGGPADRAGLKAGDGLVAVNGQRLPVVRVNAASPASYATIETALDILQAALDRGDANLAVLRGSRSLTVALHPVIGCAVGVQLILSRRRNGYAPDDRHALVSTMMVRYAANDDELAFVIAHELAHAVLHHQALLDRSRRANAPIDERGPPAKLVRQTEMEADYLGLYLMARAGFDVTAVPDLLRRLARARGPVVNFVKMHPSSRQRIAAVLATIAEIDRKRAGGEPLAPSLPLFDGRAQPAAETLPAK